MKEINKVIIQIKVRKKGLFWALISPFLTFWVREMDTELETIRVQVQIMDLIDEKWN